MNRENRTQKNNRGRTSDFIVRVTDGFPAALQGRVEHVQSGQAHFFNDFLGMLLLIQDKLDEKGYPQSDTELRSFGRREQGR